jgi:hypothetical protein
MHKLNAEKCINSAHPSLSNCKFVIHLSGPNRARYSDVGTVEACPSGRLDKDKASLGRIKIRDKIRSSA